MQRSVTLGNDSVQRLSDNLFFGKTEDFFRPAEESPSNQGYHWNGNAETYYLIGEAMGEAMMKLAATAAPREPAPAPVHLFRSADGAKTFKGQLQGYDAETKKVTVRRHDGRVIKFDLLHLHPEDQKFVTFGGKDGE